MVQKSTGPAVPGGFRRFPAVIAGPELVQNRVGDGLARRFPAVSGGVSEVRSGPDLGRDWSKSGRALRDPAVSGGFRRCQTGPVLNCWVSFVHID